ncbi:MAG TPA: hypothetical protein DCE44_16660 [Verrucomicrobiales bacterium]|nr:hypothetical protein [Verrucomicrobiales bacterium]
MFIDSPIRFEAESSFHFDCSKQRLTGLNQLSNRTSHEEAATNAVVVVRESLACWVSELQAQVAGTAPPMLQF